jgi:hypothetical protein
VFVVDVHIHYNHENDGVDRVVVVVVVAAAAAAADMGIAAIVNDRDVRIFQYLLDYLVLVHLVQNVR